MASDKGGYTDLHSHLVPGVDDGVDTLEDGLKGIELLRELGVDAIATTPHLDASLARLPKEFEARMNEVDLAWIAVKAAAGEAFPDLQFQRGFEVMLDIPDPDFSDSRTRIGGTDYVLVEWPRLQVPPATPQVLERIRDSGYRVILAHPERYLGLDPDLNLPGEWRKMGARLQVNYGSLLGRYGEAPRKRVLTFLERGWVDLFSTDFHGPPHHSLYLEKAREVLEVMDGEEIFETLARTNTGRILAGEETLQALPLVREKSVWEKIQGLFGK